MTMQDRHGAALGLAAQARDLGRTGRVVEADEHLRDIDMLVGYRTADGWHWPRDVAEAAGLARVGTGPVRMGR